jgi:hypothetical protein
MGSVTPPAGRKKQRREDQPIQAESSEADKPVHVIEEGQRLSRSALWNLQEAFYEQWGIDAWTTGVVPHYVTNNPFIANAYVRSVIGFLRDCCGAQRGAGGSAVGPPDPNQPIFIVELGAGSGRLGYLFLKTLRALGNSAVLNEVDFRYVMTDVIESSLQFWNDHPALRPFLDEGILEFALFNAEQQQEITLSRSGTVLSSETIKNPLLVLANYVFDSMTHDSFRVEDGELFEGLYTLVSQQEVDLSDPKMLQRLTIQTEYSPTGDDVYEDPILNDILASYRERLTDTSFLFPIGAVHSIRNLMTLSKGNLLLLAADKGYTDESQLLERDPSLDVQGSLSMTGMAVNCHALRQYFNQLGGHVLHTSSWDTSLVISAFFAGVQTGEFDETQAAFLEAVERFSPYHFYILVRELRKDSKNLSIEQLLSLLRLSHWDPQIMLWFAPGIRETVKAASERIKQELAYGMEQVWDNYFSIGEQDDLPFEIATILQKMDRPQEAIRYYERSRQLSGEHHATAFNTGLCFYQLGQMDEALRRIIRALELNASYQPAKEWKEHIESQLGP